MKEQISEMMDGTKKYMFRADNFGKRMRMTDVLGRQIEVSTQCNSLHSNLLVYKSRRRQAEVNNRRMQHAGYFDNRDKEGVISSN
jgi:hypothetical protein